MATFRILLAASIIGAFFGMVLASLIAPTWISSSLCGMTTDALTSRPCLDTVKHTIESMLRGQMIGAGIGASTGLALGIAWRSGKAARDREAKLTAGGAAKPPVTAAGGSVSSGTPKPPVTGA